MRRYDKDFPWIIMDQGEYIGCSKKETFAKSAAEGYSKTAEVIHLDDLRKKERCSDHLEKFMDDPEKCEKCGFHDECFHDNAVESGDFDG